MVWRLNEEAQDALDRLRRTWRSYQAEQPLTPPGEPK
jgi:hypothetical protein